MGNHGFGGDDHGDEDYYPWGGELKFLDNDSNHYKFGGHERDTETQLDYFGARYYGNWLGRFLTPDWAAKPITVPYANFGNPQSLNLYAYTKNNPTTFGDPDGHFQQSDNDKKKKSTPPPQPPPAPKPPPPTPPKQVLPDKSQTGLIVNPPCEVDCNQPIIRQGKEFLKNALGLGEVNNPAAADSDALGDPPAKMLVPLKVIHNEPPLQGSASYQEWNKKSTDEITRSLAPDAKEPLRAYPDGAIANGNTRITILKERGVDVDSLPRVIQNKTPVPDPIEPK